MLLTVALNCRPRGQRSKDAFYDDPDRITGFNPHSGHVVASIDKALYDDFLRSVVSNKQHINAGRSQTSPRKFGIRSTPERLGTIRPKYKPHRRLHVNGG